MRDRRSLASSLTWNVQFPFQRWTVGPRRLLVLATDSVINRKIDNAIIVIRKAIEQLPNDARFHIILGNDYAKGGLNTCHPVERSTNFPVGYLSPCF